ncbi:MAG: leucyl/phenylalanyl-tRNA--protein transferase [Deltaproteobacteria bacterium]|nr:leucyl/phenylalanyl-tRNA--protein transferase [Deltaproteobacteria bacterium]
MAVYRLSAEPVFPDPELAEPDGLLAMGGDLSTLRLLNAYRRGIFPWYGEGDPILWWSPDPRLVLDPRSISISKSLARTLKKNALRITLDTAFEEVITCCASSLRRGRPGTWIVPQMRAAYLQLHRAGCAHSVEAWQDGCLAGGLYGVSLGRAFFGESMFARQPDASKVCLAWLAALLRAWEFDFIDCQVTTPHLLRMGAVEIERTVFLARLRHALQAPDRTGPWRLPPDISPLMQD